MPAIRCVMPSAEKSLEQGSKRPPFQPPFFMYPPRVSVQKRRGGSIGPANFSARADGSSCSEFLEGGGTVGPVQAEITRAVGPEPRHQTLRLMQRQSGITNLNRYDAEQCWRSLHSESDTEILSLLTGLRSQKGLEPCTAVCEQSVNA